jgi:hypothetical protein
LTTAFNQSNGGLGSDGNGGSTNGEIGSKGCRTISDALDLSNNKFLILFDIFFK